MQMLIYNYPYLLQKEPRTVHAWRQYDCLSFAQNYYNNRATLLEPGINNLGNSGTGKAASEFPIIHFLVGNIWKITGINSFVYKFINLLFLLLGLFSIYKLFLFEFGNKIVSTMITAFIFTSPILSYYGVTTIGDIQSFSLSITGFYFFYKWLKNRSNSSLMIFLVCFTIAGLLKASAVFIYILCPIMLIINDYKRDQVPLKKFISLSFLFAIPVIVWFLWYSHVTNYNKQNHDTYFLISAKPFWDLSKPRFEAVLGKFVSNLIPELFQPSALGVLSIIFFISLFQINRNGLFIIICLLVFVTFILLFFGQLDVHDYYLIIPLGILTIALFSILKEWRQSWLIDNYKYFLTVVIVLTGFFSYTSGIKTWKKINDNVQDFGNYLVFNEFERKNTFWVYWIDREKFQVLEDHKFDLEKLGIKPNDLVFCLGDETPNRTLFFLNRQGYSNSNAGINETPAFLRAHQEIKYLVLIDPHLKKEAFLNELLANKIFEKESFSIYKIN
jgi:hypothetical protein